MGGTHPNTQLRRILEEIGWSPYELARRVNKLVPDDRRVNLKTPFTWRDRGTVPRDPLPSVVAGILTEARGEVVTVDQLWPGHATSRVWLPAGADISTERWCPDETLTLLGKASYPGRGGPKYFAISGTELTATARSWAVGNHPLTTTAVVTGPGVTGEFVDYLERDLANLRRLDDGQGGQLLTRAVELRLTQVAEVLRDCSYPTALSRRLYSVAGQMAQMAGWMAFDLGDDGLAQRMYLVGLRAAVAAGDRPLGALILSCVAQQQTWRNQAHDAVSIMGVISRGVQQPMPRRVRALMEMRSARAFAATGSPHKTAAALDRAFEALDCSPDESEPEWVYWLDHSVLAGEAGRCYLMLGDKPRAAAHLTDGLSSVGSDATRDRVLYGLYLALTHAPDGRAIGDVELACYQAKQVLPLIPQVGSARCRTLLNTVLAELRPHKRTPAVRELVDKSESLRGPVVC
ncbi:hypothetical protein ABZ413_33645 [Nocardia rhamnosiphila]|uniref:hypothetical protein n=1 Tax=Nocardia rhamnosiphila TaxID=426716 RepID=UPI0033CEE497